MNPRAVVFTSRGKLRAIWRIVLFLATAELCWSLTSWIVGPVLSPALRLVGLGGTGTGVWVGAFALVAATWVMVRFIDRRPISDVWLGGRSARPALLLEGFLIGAVAIGIPTVVLIRLRWLEPLAEINGSWWAAALRLAAFLLPAALNEELAMRGYLFTVLRETGGWVTALVLTSVGFGLLHLRNPGANIESIVLVTLAGLFLGGILVATRSLYAAWMAHFAWNWVMAAVFHTAVSGLPMEAPGYRYVDAGPAWATGGLWGPEGGVPAGLGMGAGTGVAYLLARRRQRPRREETSSG